MDDLERARPHAGADRAARPPGCGPAPSLCPGHTVTMVRAGTTGGGAVDCHRLAGGAAFTAATVIGSGLKATVAAAMRTHLRAGVRAVQRVLSTPGTGS